MALTPLFLLSFTAGTAPEPSPPWPPLYGAPLRRLGGLGVGPTMAVTVSGGYAYLIGRGTLRVADLAESTRPRVVGQLSGLGNTRQIVVVGDTAYVASREDGLYVVDVADPRNPALLARYDSVEFATGLAHSGDVLFIALRQFGVELVDIRDPAQPRHLSLVRTGEAQSVTCRDGWLYAGVWGTSEVVVADVRDPWRPRITARVPLGGFADDGRHHRSFPGY
ncbi:MAG: hypothetical protein HUU35_06235 [Armatimonadetes bacterium]|nr:hypothetical protein [Armatimonadota bacterium]